MTPEELRAHVEEFEGLISAALLQKYSGQPAEFMQVVRTFFPVSRWDLLKFHDAYLGGNKFPAERLPTVMHHLFDVKLELYFIMEVDAGLENRLVWDKGYNHASPRDLPHLLLTRLSLDQTMIVKSRILWERIMNCVYHLATGLSLEGKRSKSKSKKAAFFTWASQYPEWRWLEPYKARLEEFEDQYRTPEMHKGSILRAELMGKRPPRDLNATNGLLNLAINCIWENLLLIVSGGKAMHFAGIHEGPDGRINPHFLE